MDSFRARIDPTARRGRVPVLGRAAPALLAAALLALTTGSAQAQPTQADVNQGIDDAVAWLLTQQGAPSGAPAGCWQSTGVVAGVTALTMLAIIHSEPGGFSGLSPAEQTAVLAGRDCLEARAQPNGTIVDTPGRFQTYNTSPSLWALILTPGSNPAIIAAARQWFVNEQRNDGSGRPDAGGHINNGGWFYEGGPLAQFVEHSNSSFAAQALAVSGGLPAAIANLAEGYFSCLQNKAGTNCTPPGPDAATGDDGGCIYSHQGTKGGSRTSHTGSCVFALIMAGVAPNDARIQQGLAFLDASYDAAVNLVNSCDNKLHAPSTLPLAGAGWTIQPDLRHYAYWSTEKAYTLAGVADDLTDPTNWYSKLATCILAEQQGDGSIPPAGREDAVLATAFSMLALEQAVPALVGGFEAGQFEAPAAEELSADVPGDGRGLLVGLLVVLAAAAVVGVGWRRRARGASGSTE